MIRPELSSSKAPAENRQSVFPRTWFTQLSVAEPTVEEEFRQAVDILATGQALIGRPPRCGPAGLTTRCRPLEILRISARGCRNGNTRQER